MAKSLGEWAKGITFFIFVTLLFYFLWNNVFSNIIDFVGSDVFGIGSDATTSITIMKTLAWVSFIILYFAVGGVYLFHSIIVGSKGETETNPFYLLKAIGIWSIGMPMVVFFYGLTYYIVKTLNDSGIVDAGLQTTATMFSWIFALIIVIALTILPFYYVLIGYGVIAEEDDITKLDGTTNGGNNE